MHTWRLKHRVLQFECQNYQCGQRDTAVPVSAEERELSLSSRNNKGKLHRKGRGGVPGQEASGAAKDSGFGMGRVAGEEI